MKKNNSFRKARVICVAISLLTVFSANAEVPAFDSDKPVTNISTSYSQVFNTWDGATFFNQWDMVEPTIPFSATDVAGGYLQFAWPEKRVLRSKSTYSTPYVFSTVLDWSAGPTTNGGVIVRAKPDGNMDHLQEPGNDWGKMNMMGIAFYPTSDGQNLTVQFSATANGAGSTPQTRIDVPKPAGISSLLTDQGTLRIEDFGTTLYVYYRGAPYIRIDLGGLTGGVYTSGTVYNSDMTSLGTFTGMEVVASGKVGIAQRVSDIRLYSAEIKTNQVVILPARTIELSSIIGQPVTMQMEDYREGGEGVAYHDNTPGNQGLAYRSDDVDISYLGGGEYCVSYGEAGEWLEYSINVPVSGLYSFDFYVSAPFDVVFNVNSTSNTSGTVTVPNTGGWTNWQVGNLSLYLNAGIQNIRFNLLSGGNLDKAVIKLDNTTSLDNFSDNFTKCKIYPNPTNEVLNVSDAENAHLSVFTIDGRMLNSTFSTSNNAKIDVSKLKVGSYIIRIVKGDQTTNSRFIVK